MAACALVKEGVGVVKAISLLKLKAQYAKVRLAGKVLASTGPWLAPETAREEAFSSKARRGLPWVPACMHAMHEFMRTHACMRRVLQLDSSLVTVLYEVAGGIRPVRSGDLASGDSFPPSPVSASSLRFVQPSPAPLPFLPEGQTPSSREEGSAAAAAFRQLRSAEGRVVSRT